MRAMKDSGIEWIGQIPQEWHVDRLKYCADLDSEKLSEKTDPEYTFNYIDISSVTEYGGIGNTQEMTFEKSPSRARMVVHDGDTIISTVRTYLKAIAYIDGLEDHICSTGFCVVTPNEKLHPKFGYFLLQSDYFVQKIVSESVGVSYPAISSTEIGNMSIAIPVPEEQARIACYLDTKCEEIDALIAAKEKTNALLKERRQSIIYEAVTKGLNPEAPMKDSGIEWIGQIPRGWDVIRIKHLRNGDDNSFEDGDWIEAPYISDAGIRYLTTGNIGDGTYKEQGNGFVTQETFNALKCKYAYPGDLVFSRLNAPYGRTCILPNFYPEYVLAVDNVILRTDHCKEFLCYLTQCTGYQRMVEEKTNGTTMKRISRTNLGDIALPIPTLAEQKAISKYLKTECAATDAVIFTNEVTIQKLKEYRQSVIYEAVTGKIEV